MKHLRTLVLPETGDKYLLAIKLKYYFHIFL